MRAKRGDVEPGHPATKLTYADYVRLPDDGLRHEIIDGEYYATPSPVTRHQRILRRLSYAIERFLREHPIGEVFWAPLDVVLTDTDIVVPDLLYISRERAYLVTEKNLRGAPDLVVEILSPSTKSRDERLKRDLYERMGVNEYWVVDPTRNIVRVHRRGTGRFEEVQILGAADHLTSPFFPGLQLPLHEILA